MQKAFGLIIERLEEESTQWNKVRSIYERTGECDNYTDGRVEAFGEAITIVNKVAEEYSHRNSDLVIDSSHRNDGWIPCERELPKDKREVLVWDSNQEMCCVAWINPQSQIWYSNDFDFEDSKYIIAWRELPQPYVKGE